MMRIIKPRKHINLKVREFACSFRDFFALFWMAGWLGRGDEELEVEENLPDSH